MFISKTLNTQTILFFSSIYKYCTRVLLSHIFVYLSTCYSDLQSSVLSSIFSVRSFSLHLKSQQRLRRKTNRTNSRKWPAKLWASDPTLRREVALLSLYDLYLNRQVARYIRINTLFDTHISLPFPMHSIIRWDHIHYAQADERQGFLFWQEAGGWDMETDGEWNKAIARGVF
jgi:hypothetical protein